MEQYKVSHFSRLRDYTDSRLRYEQYIILDLASVSTCFSAYCYYPDFQVTKFRRIL